MVRFRKQVDEHKSIHDNETHERLGPVVNTIRIKPENFTKLSNDSIGILVSINPRALQVLLVAVKYSTFTESNDSAGNFFANDMLFKQRCLELIRPEISKDYVNKCISDLNQAGIIQRQQRGIYLIKPDFFLKGKVGRLHCQSR